MAQSQKPVCAVCIRIRWFLLFAVPLVVLMGTQTDMQPPEIPLHEIVAQGILLALVVVLGWRIVEYRSIRSFSETPISPSLRGGEGSEIQTR